MTIKILSVDPKIIRFLVVGGLNTVLGFGLFPFIYWLLDEYRSHYVVMLICCHLVLVLNAYVLNKMYVFRTQGYSQAEITKFFLFHMIHLAIVLLVVPVFVEYVNINPPIVQSIVCLLIAIFSFFWYDKVVFLSKNREIS